MNNALRAVVVTFGILAAIVAMQHGIGTLLQGNIARESVVFESWPDDEAYDILAGEPALTVIPNLFGAGVVTLLVSAAVVFWLVISVHQKLGWLGLAVLSATLLLVGGGFWPPLILFVLVAGAASIRGPLKGWRKRPEKVRRRLSRLWPLCFAIGLAGYLSLFPGMVLLNALAGITYEPAVPIASGVAFAFLGLSLMTAAARDSLGTNSRERSG